MQLGLEIMERWFLGKENEIKTKSGRDILAVLKKKDIFWWTE